VYLRRARVLPIAALLSISAVMAAERPSDIALFRAIESNDLSAMKEALRSGAQVNAKDQTGATPLMRASVYGTTDSMKLLLARGADPNIPNNFGGTALMWSAGNLEKVRLLLGAKADVNVKSNSGRTPLTVAASHAGNVETVKLLLAKGADVKASPDGVGGAVYSAANAGDESILRVLLAAGGDPNDRNPFDISALIAACQFGRIEPVQLLLDAGANVNHQSGRRPLSKAGLQELGELTALLVAAPTGNPKLVKMLLDRGADIKAKDMRGMSPLMMATSSEHQDGETVRLLLAGGSDPKAISNDGQTPVSWARKWGSRGVFELIAEPDTEPFDLKPAKVRDTHHEGDLRESIEKAIALLQTSSDEYFRKSGCTGCHHQMLTGMAVGLARDHGLKANEQRAAEQLKTAITVRQPDRESSYLAVARGGAPMADSLLLISLAARKYQADPLTNALAHIVASMQSQDGSWRSHIVRQPIQYSTFTETAYAVRALQLYSAPGRKVEYQKRIDRARAWLSSNVPEHNEDRVKHLLGLYWSGAKPQSIAMAARHLIEDQQPDGGWSQRSGFESDAYATGQTLYALYQAGALPASDTVYRRGVAFLRKSQLPDGSWYVRSRSVKFQPYFDSAFPHHHDQWISAAGSAWAAMALTLACEPSAVASR
jgi:ankyrin repeat protein